MRILVNLRRPRYILYYLFVLFLLCAMYYIYCLTHSNYRIESDTTMILYAPRSKKNMCCYYEVAGDILPPVEDSQFTPGDKPIFFLETSCSGGLNSRQACAVESAARLHKSWQINLLFSAPVTEDMLRQSNLAKLRELGNVKFARIHIEEYGKGTVVEPILVHHLKKSLYPIEHASDILRILTLHKFGGVYLDTDAFLIQNLDSLPVNWIAKESDKDLASGAMSFSKDGVGTAVTRAVLIEIHNTYAPESWSVNGPGAIYRVLERSCADVLKTAGDCEGVEIFTPEFFYPIHYNWRHVYFKNGSIDNMEGPYMHHMWNYLTRNMKVEAGSPFAKLARKYCPTIYEMYGNKFGE